MIYRELLIAFVISSTLLAACKSTFPVAGTVVDCNGQQIKPLTNPTQKASFPGGEQAFSAYFKKNVKFSQEAVEQKGKGNVAVAFVVTKEGHICDIRIVSKPNKYIDDEVIRVVKMMPDWIPATNNGDITDSYYVLSLRF